MAASKSWCGWASYRAAVRACRRLLASWTSRSPSARPAARGINGTAPARPAAAPLTWAQAQELRLIIGLGDGRTVETPAVTTARFVTNGPPGALTVAVTAPTSGTTLGSPTTTVTGATAPGASVDIASADTTTGALPSVVSTVAAPDGSFSATV